MAHSPVSDPAPTVAQAAGSQARTDGGQRRLSAPLKPAHTRTWPWSEPGRRQLRAATVQVQNGPKGESGSPRAALEVTCCSCVLFTSAAQPTRCRRHRPPAAATQKPAAPHKKHKVETGGANILRFFDKQPEVGKRRALAVKGRLGHLPPACWVPVASVLHIRCGTKRARQCVHLPSRKGHTGMRRARRGESHRRWVPQLMASARRQAVAAVQQRQSPARRRRGGPPCRSSWRRCRTWLPLIA